MLFEWTLRDGIPYPFISVFLSRGAHRPPELTQMLLDTGADCSIQRTVGIGGSVTGWSAKNAGIVGRIGIYDVPFPELQFIRNALPILGRDALFGRLELKMNRDEIELREIH